MLPVRGIMRQPLAWQNASLHNMLALQQQVMEGGLFLQDDFDNIMKEYPESSKAMNLIAEHRLRALYASAAWQSKRDALTDYRSANLGAKIEHMLKVIFRRPQA